MKEYLAQPASPGLVVGQVRRLQRGIVGLSRIIEEPNKERVLLDAAVAIAKDELQELAERAVKSDKDIFSFQCCLLEDEGLMNEAYNYIAAGAGAAAAMERVGKIYAERLRSMVDNEYLQLRGVDVLDACHRVVSILDGGPRRKLLLDHPMIVAADVLMPSDLFSVPAGLILGLATSEGSPQSHAAIIARSLNIPAVVQLGREFLESCDGHVMAMDAETGHCILDPDTAAQQRMIARICEHQQTDQALAALRDVPCRTRSGETFELLANCYGPEDIETAMELGASGVGLLRSEYLMLQGRMPDEQEQYFFYTSCLAAARGTPVTIRTFDLGADKITEDFLPGAQNSALGIRGIRYCLQQPQVFETQLCALLRAAARGPLKIMFPMISRVEDWDAAVYAVEHCKEILRRRNVPFREDVELGMTFEVPAACLMAEEFTARGCCFIALGTNDLVQYTHAADRNLSRLEPYYQTNSLAMRKLIRMTVEAADAAHIPLSVCGLSVSNPEYAKLYLRMGVHTFSMAAQNVLRVKAALLDAEAVPGAEKM